MSESDRQTEPRRYGEFVLQDKLGVGGMGVVYRATHDRFGDIVVKQIGGAFKPEGTALRRFQREALAAQRVDSPRVVRCYGLEQLDGNLFKRRGFRALCGIGGSCSFAFGSLTSRTFFFLTPHPLLLLTPQSLFLFAP